MNIEKEIERSTVKDRGSIDPDDPVFQIVEIFKTQQAEAMEGLGRMIAKAAEDIATTIVMADNTARTKEQVLITKVARLGADKIQSAGIEAANTVSARFDKAVAKVETAANMAMKAAWISAAGAVTTVLAVIILVFLIFH
jgi:hypothetical protein